MDIEIKNVNFLYSDNLVIDDLSVLFKTKKIHLIIGPSGGGKSTLLRLMNALLEPESGDIFLDGHCYKKIHPLLVRKRVGMIFQKPVLFEGTVYDNLVYGLKLHKMDIDEARIKKIVDDFDIPSEYLKKKGEELSIGEQQRISIIRTLLIEPDIILFDEPVSGLDPQRVGKVMEHISKLKKDYKKTIIMVSHVIEYALNIADRLYFMDKGKIIFSGSPDEINHTANSSIKNFIRGIYG